MLSRIFSISSMISGVSLGITLSALRLSVTCSGLDAPRMTVLTLGFLAAHARARWVTVQSSLVWARVDSFLTFSILEVKRMEMEDVELKVSTDLSCSPVEEENAVLEGQEGATKRDGPEQKRKGRLSLPWPDPRAT